MDTQTLTAEAIDAMPAGPEMDRLLAERVMSARVRRNSDGLYDLIIPGQPRSVDWVERDGAWEGVPHYSRDIAAAWQVVEHLRAQGWEMTLSVNHYVTNPWDCRLFLTDGGKLDAPRKRVIAHGPDAAAAISRAALKATL